jgi:hypothetical protein
MFGYTIFVDMKVEHWFVGGGKQADEVSVTVIFKEVYLACFVDSEDSCPYEYQCRFEICRWG